VSKDFAAWHVAMFDQALASKEASLDALLDLYRSTDPGAPGHKRLGLLCWHLHAREDLDRQALIEHLVVALRRLDRLRQSPISSSSIR
jgi:hypothetical protein